MNDGRSNFCYLFGPANLENDQLVFIDRKVRRAAHDLQFPMEETFSLENAVILGLEAVFLGSSVV